MIWSIFISVGLVAMLHLYFGILEMFLWTKPATARKFGLTHDFAIASKVLAANQGLYNYFLSAGLFYGLHMFQQSGALNLIVLHLCFVIIAGIYGGYTVGKKLFFIQSVPAIIALAITLVAAT